MPWALTRQCCCCCGPWARLAGWLAGWLVGWLPALWASAFFGRPYSEAAYEHRSCASKIYMPLLPLLLLPSLMLMLPLLLLPLQQPLKPAPLSELRVCGLVLWGLLRRMCDTCSHCRAGS